MAARLLPAVTIKKPVPESISLSFFHVKVFMSSDKIHFNYSNCHPVAQVMIKYQQQQQHPRNNRNAQSQAPSGLSDSDSEF